MLATIGCEKLEQFLIRIMQLCSFVFFSLKESTSPTGEETYLKIKEEFLNASCKPRDTILDAFHELNIDRGYQTLFPECVVVQRCKNGGCCLEHQECTSISSEYKTFYVSTASLMVTIFSFIIRLSAK